MTGWLWLSTAVVIFLGSGGGLVALACLAEHYTTRREK